MLMKRLLWLFCLAATAALPLPTSAQTTSAQTASAQTTSAQPTSAQTQHSKYDGLIAAHAQENLVPEALVHRVIVRESKYQPALVGRGGAIGLMQIKLATARALGYSGTADGLRDPETNLKYAVKYLAGAYRAAKGDFNRAVRYYAGGYYQVAKQQRLEHVKEAKNTVPGVPPKPLLQAAPDAKQAAADAKAQQTDTEQADNSQPATASQEQESDTSANAR
jgi:soluble lytic murein transglycosylase-like protein